MSPADAEVLPALPLPGLRPHALGRYLAALGLLRIAARHWGDVRGAWRDDCFWLVGGPRTMRDLASYLRAPDTPWSCYEHGWKKAQDDEKKRKKGAPSPYLVWLSEQDEETTELALAHLVIGSTRYFNPLTGSGGNAGRRVFSKGWSEAQTAVRTKPNGWTDRTLERELVGFLDGTGGPLRPKEGWSAASWFIEANKAANSGQAPTREGQVSPWAMLLACEGLPFFVGAPSRRLGASTRRLGAFPFVTAPAAPVVAGEAGRDQAEVWTPLWERPMSAAEVRVLFRRGRAELGGRGVVTPAAMAAAIVSRGVDAGVVGFVRHALGATTSGNTFEPRRIGRVDLTQSAATHAQATAVALSRIVDLRERLPRDEKKGQRWIFRGLRGPIEASLIRYAAAPDDHDAATRLLDAVVDSLERVNVTRSFREDATVELELLPLPWLTTLLEHRAPTAEMRLAMGLTSLLDEPFLVHRWGVRRVSKTDARYRFTQEPQARCVWATGPLASNLSRVLRRRLVDAERETKSRGLTTRASFKVKRDDIAGWLTGLLDEVELARWIDRFALFDWRVVPESLRRVSALTSAPAPIDGVVTLWGLLRPLLDGRSLSVQGHPLFTEARDPRTVRAGRSMVARLNARDIPGALDLAASRYQMAGHPLGRVGLTPAVDEPAYLISSLLLQPRSWELEEVTQRWLRPARIGQT